MAKIVITGPDLNEDGGVSNYVQMLLRHRSSLHHDIYYVPVGMKSQLRRYGWLSRIINWPLRLIYYTYALASIRPSIVHLNPSLDPKSLIRDSINANIGAAFGLKILVFFQGWQITTEKKLFDRFSMIGFFGRSLIRLATRIIVLGITMEQTLVQLGVDPSKITRLPIMVDFNTFQNIECDPPDEASSQPMPKVLFLSRLKKGKGVNLLLDASELLRANGRDLAITIAGDGPRKNEILNSINKRGLTETIKMPGHVRGKEKICLYIASSVFVLPSSLGEGFPNVIAEAMAAGLPIITTKVGGIPDILKEGVHCLYLKEITPADLAVALARLLDDDDLRTAMRRQNKRTAAEQMDVAVVLKQLDGVYKELAT